MSSFGKQRESGEGFVSKLYTGVENFVPTLVNPGLEDLKKIYGDNAKEDTYVSTTEEGKPQLKIVIYLDNKAEEGEESIKTRLTFFVVADKRVSQAGDKTQFINAYGQSTWLPNDGSIPENMNWYDAEGKREAFRGEDLVIDFLRNLLNLPSKDKADKPEDAKSQFTVQEWQKMFSGDMSPLKGIISQATNKIGILLGVKTVEDGKMYQDVYNRKTLRQYTKASGKFDYLRNDVVEAQNNGAYSSTDFGNPDYTLREYVAGETLDNGPALQEESADNIFGQFSGQ